MVLNNSKNNVQYENLDGCKYVYTESSNLFGTNYLNDRYNKYAIKNSIEHKLTNLVNQNNNQYILNVNIDDLIDFLSAEYIREMIVLKEEEILHDVKDQNISLRQVNKSYHMGNTSYYGMNGSVYTFTIPVFGYVEALKDLKYWNRIKKVYGVLKDNCIEIKYYVPTVEASNINIQENFDANLDVIKNSIIKINKDIEETNSIIKPIVKECIIKKQEEIRPLEDLKKTIKYPLKKNPAVPETFPVPLKKKEIKIPQVDINLENVKQEPIIDLSDYNHILKICSDMTLVMERSPKAFVNMDEESLRTHFLVQLNGHYEGQATGETFNSIGKTDILIRNDNQNVFIAECKFWKGEQVYSDTIDQLLGYITYRDTKTAILVFVKNKDFTNVLNKIQEVTPTHENFVNQDKSYNPPIESAYRYIFRNKNDENKKFFLTVIAFHVPIINESSC